MITVQDYVKRLYRSSEGDYQNGERIYQTMIRYQEFLSCLYRQKRIAQVLYKYYAYTIGEQVKQYALQLRNR